jgi:hypothetical protein
MNCLGIVSIAVLCFFVASSSNAQTSQLSKVSYVDTLFENASPLWYEVDASGTLQIHLTYDHERDSPNRAAGHIHFCVHGEADKNLRIEFNHLDNVWNGTPGSVAKELLSLAISEDGKEWRSCPLSPTSDGRVFGEFLLKSDRLFVARVEPYRLSDLDRMLNRLRVHPDVSIDVIGQTVEGRTLEIIRLGNERSRDHVFLRARAHPWEAGGNWVVEGVIDRMLANDKDGARLRDKLCIHVLPMANKDGVARGRTRFNSKGKDLNRNWDKPANSELAPENAALEKWIEQKIADGHAPAIALELHNDGNGKLHISRPLEGDTTNYLERMELFESLLRRHTWFSEGATKPNFRNPGSLGEGWMERFRIDAIVHEFNCNVIASTGQRPLAMHWKEYGSQLPIVFEEYFKLRKH